jgi:hypothetical protein
MQAQMDKVNRIDDVRQGIINSGLIDAVNSHGGGGSLDWSQFPGLKPSDVAGTYTGGSGTNTTAYNYTGYYSSGSNVSSYFLDLTNTFNSFSTSMQGTGVYSLASNFFQASSLPAGSPVPISINTENYGNHTFDWSMFSGIFPVLRGVILIAFGYASVRVVGRGGGG